MTDTLNVTYILLHFPYLTETFIAEEIQALRELGVRIRIVSLLKPGPGPVQSISRDLLPDTWYAPSILSFRTWLAQIVYLVKSPARYFGLLLTLLRQPYPRKPFSLLAKRLIIFLKAVASARFLENREVQLLHAHFAWLPAAGAWIISRLLKLPFTATMHAYDVYAKTDLVSLIVHEADHVVSISDYNRNQVLQTQPAARAPISVIHCGVDLSKLGRIPQPETAAGRPFNILSVGSLIPKKGHRYLIEACRRLALQGLEFSCSIIGSGFELDALKALVTEYGLERQVHLVGPKVHQEIIAAYRQADVFALAGIIIPSGDRDGIPVVLMEAGAMEVPLVSTDISGIPEIVHDGKTGFIVPSRDADALAQALTTLAGDPLLRQRFGRNARQLIEKEFDIRINAERLQNLFAQTAVQHSR